MQYEALCCHGLSSLVTHLVDLVLLAGRQGRERGLPCANKWSIFACILAPRPGPGASGSSTVSSAGMCARARARVCVFVWMNERCVYWCVRGSMRIRM